MAVEFIEVPLGIDPMTMLVVAVLILATLYYVQKKHKTKTAKKTK